jgi:hypothetical protein
MCGTIDLGSCIRWVLGFGIKTGYDSTAAWWQFEFDDKCSYHTNCEGPTSQAWQLPRITKGSNKRRFPLRLIPTLVRFEVLTNKVSNWMLQAVVPPTDQVVSPLAVEPAADAVTAKYPLGSPSANMTPSGNHILCSLSRGGALADIFSKLAAGGRSPTHGITNCTMF